MVTRSHSRFLSAKELCERALRKINAYSINDTAADPEHLAEALLYFDMIVAELAGTNKCFWLMPTTVEIPLTADTASYDLSNAMGSDYPDGILYPIAAAIRDSSGFDEPVDLLNRQQWLDVVDKDESGTTSRVYIDRITNDQTLYVHPVVSESNAFTLLLDVQTYAPDMTKNGGKVQPELGPEWNLYLITELSGYVGDGPIRRINPQTIRTWKQESAEKKARLLNFRNQDDVAQSGPRRTASWGGRY